MFNIIAYKVITSTIETIDTVGMVDGGEADSIKLLRHVD